MLKRGFRYTMLCAGATFSLSCSPAGAGSLNVGTTYVLASPIGAQFFGRSDLINSFVEYYFEKGVEYDTIAMTVTTPDSMVEDICKGNASGYDLVMLPGKTVYKLLRRCHKMVIGSPFIFGFDTLSLYSKNTDISNGLPSSLTTPFAVADPKEDAYGIATSQLLDTFPRSRHASAHGIIQTRPDTPTVQASIEDYPGPNTVKYGFIAKSQICGSFGGTEYYNFDVGLYHHNYSPSDSSHPYFPIPLVGIKVVNKRTPDQENELNQLVAYTLGVGTNRGTNALKEYCLQLPGPHPFYPW